MKTHIKLLALALFSHCAQATDVTGSSDPTAKREPAAAQTAAPQSASTNTAAGNASGTSRGRGFGGPIELKPDDKPALPNPPEGFDKTREGIERGKLERVDYDSKTVGVKRWMQVYTPPGYSRDKKYPVLYCSTALAATSARSGQREVSPM